MNDSHGLRVRRGVTAAIASYIEERGGLKLFTLEGEWEGAIVLRSCF